MKIKTPMLAAAVTSLVLLCATGCTPKEMTAAKATDKGLVQVNASGIDLENMSISITSTKNIVVVLPVGTRFLSSASGTQNMIAASTMRFAFTDASPSSPQTLTQQVPVYCINRFLDVPTTSSDFSVSYTEETDPIRKLVACMENKSGSHRAKQIAVWMISDNLLDLTKDEVVDKFMGETESKWRKHSSGPDLAKMVRENNPDTPEELLEAIRNLSSDQIGAMFDQLQPVLRKQAESEARKYAEQSASLLADCGYDLSNKRFFQ